MHVNAPVKHPARIVIKDAVKIFVTVAMRLGVIHHHVMINQLLASRQVQARSARTRAPVPSSRARMLLRANAAAQRDGMMRRAAIAPQRAVQPGHMKRRRAFVLKFHVLHLRVIAHNTAR